MKLIIPPPLQALLFFISMWLVARATPGFSFELPSQTIIAIILGVFGLGLELVAVGAFRQAKTTISPFTPQKTSAIVASGLYRYSRNPMYLGMLILLTAWGIYLGNAMSLVFLPIFVVAITELQIKPEEEALRAKFGADYDAYCQKVRRWI